MAVNFDLNTVIMAFIAGLISVVFWFTRKWGMTIETQVNAIHTDLKEHNDRSDKTHSRLYGAIAIEGQRISKIEGKLEGREE